MMFVEDGDVDGAADLSGQDGVRLVQPGHALVKLNLQRNKIKWKKNKKKKWAKIENFFFLNVKKIEKGVFEYFV